jgi:hypothetical protein
MANSLVVRRATEAARSEKAARAAQYADVHGLSKILN